jgi:hypothetical protein
MSKLALLGGEQTIVEEKTYMDYLRDNGYTVISLRGLAKYIDPKRYAGDPLKYATIGLERKRTAI